MASALLMEGASVFTADRKGNTALHYSCFSGDSAVDITKALLRSKADMWYTNAVLMHFIFFPVYICIGVSYLCVMSA